MEGKSKRGGLTRKAIGLLAALATLATGGVVSAATSTDTAAAASVLTTSYDRTLGDADFEAARNEYGLTKEIKDGNCLHAWMWSSNTLKANMKAIAEAGWTSIQTEPVQLVLSNPDRGMTYFENWWYVYQPIDDTKVGNFVMGSEEEFKAMCDEAHKYGVRIIVDVVANHFTSDWSKVQGKWSEHKSDWFRGGGGTSYNIQNWGDRYEVTHKALLGLWEINSDNPETGKAQQEYLKQIVADGADGFRYDAAKHIELPGEFSEDTNGSPYWTYMLDNGAQYQYGEVLQDSISHDSDYEKLFSEHSSNGGGVTASGFGYTVRTAITSGTMRASDLTSYADPAPADHVVTWVESHDNFANKEQASYDIASISDDKIALGWVIIGSRQEGMPLYFNRPKGDGGRLFTCHDPSNGGAETQCQFSETGKLGDTGNDMWKDKRITAVNHFRNQMDGNVEYLHNTADNKVLMVERYNTDSDSSNDGMAVANSSGDVSLVGVDTKLDDGTYPDQVNSGNSITVAGGKITAGTAKAGVSVFFNPGKASSHGSVSASPADSNFKTDTLTVTLSSSLATGTTYTTSEGDSGSYENGDKIMIGGSSEVGDTITLTLTGTDASGDEKNDGKALKATYTYHKVEAGAQNLGSQYSTNADGYGAKKTITVDGDISDWDESMRIAQGSANDDPRVYMENSMWECPIDLYALYGAYDDTNLYLMWEYTNVQDVIDPGDDYPLSQCTLYKSQNLAQWIAVNTGKDDVIGNGVGLQTGGTIWDNGLTFVQPVNRLVEMSTNGSNGPWIYTGDSTGLDSYATYGAGESTDKSTGKVTHKTNTTIDFGMGILESSVKGKDGAWGATGNPARVVGDVANDDNIIDFTAKGHSSASMDFHYELAIPLADLGTDAATVDSTGISVQVLATFGLSAMDSLPYDVAMNDNADQPDTKSQALNSYEKSDKDEMSANFACINKCPTGGSSQPKEKVDATGVTVSGDGVTDGAVSKDISDGDNQLQLTATVAPSNATNKKVTWSSSDEKVATVDSNGAVTLLKAGTATITATTAKGSKSDAVSGSVTVTVTGEIVAVSAVSVAPADITLEKGDTQSLEAVVTPDNATSKKVTWTSSDEKVATVDSTGKVTAVGRGSATITATAGGVKGSAHVTVTSSSKNVIYAKVGWSKAYAYLYNGEGTSASSNAAWPGAAMTPITGTDDCGQTGFYYEVPDEFATAGTKVILNDGGSNRSTPDMVPGMDYTSGTVVYDGTTAVLSDVSCKAATVAVTGVTADPATVSVEVGSTAVVSATVAPANASNKSVTWESDDPTVATVSAAGVVKGVKAGTATLTVTTADGAKTATVAVTVTGGAQPTPTPTQTPTTPAPTTKPTANPTIDPNGVTSVKISPTSLQLNPGDTSQLTATVLPETATDKTVTWSSSNASVATVAADGTVTAVSQGITAIVASTSNGKADIVRVTVTAKTVAVSSVKLDKASAKLQVGETAQFTATVTPDNATNGTVSWETTEPAIATVDATGKVTAKKVGSTTLIAITPDGHNATASIVVDIAAGDVAVTGVTVTPSTLALTVGETGQLAAAVAPADATDKDITWTSGNTAVATVDATGKVTAVAAGLAVITAKSANGVSGSSAVQVTAKSVDPDTPDTPDAPVTAESVTLDAGSLALTAGDTHQLTATVLPANAQDKSVTWLSSDEKVATVDATGKVTAVAAGSALVTATTSNGKSASATVTVTAVDTTVPVASVTLAPSVLSLSMADGKTGTLAAIVAPSNATDKALTWASADQTIATVDANGVVTPVKAGTTLITATASNGVAGVAQVTVAAAPTPDEPDNTVEATGVTVTPNTLTLQPGETATLAATVLPATATDKTVTWASGNTAVATVDNAGKVTAVSNGLATITVTTANGKTAAAAVQVATPQVDVPVTAVTVDPASLDLKVGATQKVTATVAPDNATDKTVRWQSSAPQVASVSSDGTVIALAAGTATVTAYAGDKAAVVNVTVTADATTVPVTAVTVNPTSLDLKVGATAKVTATVAPDNATVKTVTWSSLRPQIATVSDDGTVTGVSSGQAVIVARSGTALAQVMVDVTVDENRVPVESITITPSTIQLKVGATATATATVLPSNATDKTVTWTSGSPSAFTVDNNGTITAVSQGVGYLVATSADGVFGTAVVTVESNVQPSADESVTVDKNALTLKVGESATVTATVQPAGTALSWLSQNPGIATVNNGVITGVASGMTNVMVSTAGGASAIVQVAVNEDTPAPAPSNSTSAPAPAPTGTTSPTTSPSPTPTNAVTITPSPASVNVGTTVALSATASLGATTFTWTSTNTSIARVDDSGVVTGVAAGSTYVLATAADGTRGSVQVFVSDPAKPAPTTPTTIELTPSEFTIQVGTSLAVSAKVTPAADGLTWTSADDTIATVDANGTVTGVKAGITSVMVTTADGTSQSALVTVIDRVEVDEQVMYRVYNPFSGEHFYTADEEEKNGLVAIGWNDEGVGWIAPKTSNTPVYRVYNPFSGDHHYTVDKDEYEGLVDSGWVDEGIGWYSAENEGRAQLYREYNLNAIAGSHNYTLSAVEHANVVAAGWKDEGLAWYAVRSTNY